MALRKQQPRYLALPGKQGMQRATFLLLVTAGLVLFVMSKANNPAAEKLKTSMMDALVPVLNVAASPFDAINTGVNWMHEMAALRAENIALKNENLELLKWQSAAKSMTQENASLRSLLNVVPSQTHGYTTVKIVSDMSGPYVHSALINGGTANDIKPNEAVINESGLLGKTLDVGTSSARVLLLSDINSRVPVVSEKTHEKSILAGNNNEMPTLAYLAANSKIAVGERIVTSGDGGVFPAGIPVGVVMSVNQGDIKVQPFVDPSSVDYVSVIDYTF